MRFIYLFSTLYALKVANCVVIQDQDPKFVLSDIINLNIGGAPEKLITAVVNHGDKGAVTETLQVVNFDDDATVTILDEVQFSEYGIQERLTDMERATEQKIPMTVTFKIQTEVTAPASDFYLVNGNYYLNYDNTDDSEQYATMTLSSI